MFLLKNLNQDYSIIFKKYAICSLNILKNFNHSQLKKYLLNIE
ncbi:hypothetical protein CV652_05860 [Borreliella burgdorferi]|nr:hypothetical protein CV652_05860 [Borreliella burgdorferi]